MDRWALMRLKKARRMKRRREVASKRGRLLLEGQIEAFERFMFWEESGNLGWFDWGAGCHC